MNTMSRNEKGKVIPFILLAALLLNYGTDE